jgi:acyl-coenzyme A synthetase/AMP-(fatty) acid ligase
MIFEYIYQDGSREQVDISLKEQEDELFKRIDSSNKKEFIQNFLARYNAGNKIVLFDKNHKQLLEFYEREPIENLRGAQHLPKDTSLLFFTSGSTGFPVGAFKSRRNLESEVAVLKDIVNQRALKKVVVTVPFVHIYGILAGLLLPLALDNVTLVVKEDFLPYELLEEADEEGVLVITTPVFIKALGKLAADKKLNGTLFISSTGPLQREDIEIFEKHYGADVMQLFGSTETGGMAYKFSTEELWKALDGVSVSQKDEKLSVRSPFISEFILDEGIHPLTPPFVTEDIVEIAEDGFKLLGRSNKIIKIAGKRISAVAIENILEEIAGVERAVVEILYKKELLRSEQIRITLQSKEKIEKRIIKEKIAEAYGVLTIPFTLVYVDKIALSAMGKKILF